MNEIPYKKYLAFAVPYSIAVSLLYLFGYWGFFRINVLEFVGFDDIAKLALYPLLGALLSLLAGFATSQVLLGDRFPPGGGAHSRIGQFVQKHEQRLIAVNILLVLISAFFLPVPGKWFVVTVLVAFFSMPMTDLDYFIALIPNPRLRGTILSLFISVAAAAFAFGNYDAHIVKTGYGKTIVDMERSKMSLRTSESSPVMYLGFIGGYFVLYETTTDSLILVKEKGDAPLVLRRNPKRS
jgi:hypothetical protein